MTAPVRPSHAPTDQFAIQEGELRVGGQRISAPATVAANCPTPAASSMQFQDDYRLSHLERGGSYDTLLAEAPFDAYMAEWERRHLREIVRQRFPAGPRRYLDFACGTGRITATVAPSCGEAVAVDLSPSMIDAARQKAPAAIFHLCDLTRDEIDLGTFNLITAFRFFGNAQDDLRESAMRALVKRLAPDGFLVINNHRNPRALYALLDRLTGGSSGEMDLHMPKLRRLLRRHGLKIRHTQPIGAWMYRSRMLSQHCADDNVAIVNERRFRYQVLSAIAPDTIVTAQRC